MYSLENNLFYSKSFGIVLTLFVVWLFRYLINLAIRIRSLPPGPWGVPILGYLPFLRKSLYLEFDLLAKRFGSVYSLKLGKHNVVIINDWNHLKEVFANESLLARPHERLFAAPSDPPSFVEMSGDTWRDHRQTAMSILRNVGLGKGALEDKIREEIDQFLTTITSGPVNFEEKIMPSVSNNIAILLFGHKFDYTDPAKVKLDETFNYFNKTASFAGLTVFLPWLSVVLTTLGKINNSYINEAILFVRKLIQSEIDKHVEKMSENEMDDYIDGYLIERKNRQRKGQNIDHFSTEILLRNASDFFGAGSETVVATLSWAMVYLVKYPEFQDKIRAEIMETIGTERKPMYSDRNQMPFTLAFLNETHRHATVLPVNLLRRASKDTKVGNFNIPKDCIVIFNFWSIHRDPKLWDNPDEFNPNRFLVKTDEDETKSITPKYLVPFSGGKRACPGEALAQVELFLYLTNILQKFKISTEPGVEITFEAHYGLARRPKVMPKLIFTQI